MSTFYIRIRIILLPDKTTKNVVKETQKTPFKFLFCKLTWSSSSPALSKIRNRSRRNWKIHMSMHVGREKDTYKNIRTSAVIETAVQLNIFYTKGTEHN